MNAHCRANWFAYGKVLIWIDAAFLLIDDIVYYLDCKERIFFCDYSSAFNAVFRQINYCAVRSFTIYKRKLANLTLVGTNSLWAVKTNLVG